MIYVQVADRYFQDGVEDLLINTAQAALQHRLIGTPEDELSIVLTGDEEIQQLNNQYLGIDAPTDVLSFSGGDIDPENGKKYLGDIIISYPRARSQADARGGTALSEMQLLVVHGILHLLGYDHAEDQEKKEMWSIQVQILKEFGLDSINPA
jgi:probable rRNA maturation factor